MQVASNPTCTSLPSALMGTTGTQQNLQNKGLLWGSSIRNTLPLSPGKSLRCPWAVGSVGSGASRGRRGPTSTCHWGGGAWEVGGGPEGRGGRPGAGQSPALIRAPLAKLLCLLGPSLTPSWPISSWGAPVTWPGVPDCLARTAHRKWGGGGQVGWGTWSLFLGSRPSD